MEMGSAAGLLPEISNLPVDAFLVDSTGRKQTHYQSNFILPKRVSKLHPFNKPNGDDMITKRKKWHLKDAKNRFTEVIRRAKEEGPQTITEYGKDSFVVLSAEDYKKLEPSDTSLVTFFRNSPLANSGVDLSRDKSFGRDFEL
ncbi:type II toxin-antitoxin system Phd/YefM family antitoxin [Cyclonatronum proteinivorum]|nr:type II toxin-antitoxin system Phd/YefM family antitoxin [Cyclonatronum proteinivorum]